jgi:hypothetical protein
MPKGHKSTHGYSTVAADVGLGFREIAEKMTADGDEMNHATARNVLLRGLMKISRPLLSLHGKSGEGLDHEAWRVASDPRFQQAMVDIFTDELSRQKQKQ